MENDGTLEAFQHRGGLVVGRARVHDDRLAQIGGDRQVPVEQAPLRIARGVIAEEVEPGLADPNRPVVPEERRQLGHSLGFVATGLMGVNSERCEDSVVSLGYGERRAARLDSGPHGDDPLHACGAGARDERLRIFGARVEVRVRVDHATAAAPARVSSSGSMRGKRGGAARIPVAASAFPGRTRSHDRSSLCPSASRIRGAVSGT